MRLAFPLVALCMASCAHGDWTPLDRSAFPGPEATARANPRASLAVLEAIEQVDYFPGPHGPVADVTERTRYLILRDGAGTRVAFASYDRAFSEVLDFRARAVLPDGTTREWHREEADDRLAFPDWLLFDESRLISIELGNFPAGTVIEEVQKIRWNQAPLFLQQHTFGGSAPVALERYEVTAPADWQLGADARRLDQLLALPPSIEREAGRIRTVWEMRDLPASEPEPQGPPLSATLPTVSIHLQGWPGAKAGDPAFTSAEALSAWLYDASHRNGAPATERLRSEAERILEKAPPAPKERARLLYEWVRDRISYCAVEIGMGGWIPHAAEQVIDVRYGDCKDKANLLHALLDAVGIPSRLAAIQAHGGWARPFVLPALAGNFNHMVLIVDLPEGPLLLDPTDPTAPFGTLPAGDRGTDYLPLQAGGASLQHTPPLAPEENARAVRFDLALDPTGKLSGKAVLKAVGAAAASVRNRWRAGGPADAFAPELALAPGASAREVALDSVEPASDEVEGRGLVELRPVATADGRLVIRSAQLLRDPVVHLLPGSRRSPVLLQPAAEGIELRIALPAGARIRSLPAPVEWKDANGSYALGWKAEEGALLLQRKRVVAAQSIPAEEAPRFREVQARIADAEHGAVVIELAR